MLRRPKASGRLRGGRDVGRRREAARVGVGRGRRGAQVRRGGIGIGILAREDLDANPGKGRLGRRRRRRRCLRGRRGVVVVPAAAARSELAPEGRNVLSREDAVVVRDAAVAVPVLGPDPGVAVVAGVEVVHLAVVLRYAPDDARGARRPVPLVVAARARDVGALGVAVRAPGRRSLSLPEGRGGRARGRDAARRDAHAGGVAHLPVVAGVRLVVAGIAAVLLEAHLVFGAVRVNGTGVGTAPACKALKRRVSPRKCNDVSLSSHQAPNVHTSCVQTHRRCPR